jgi:ligand-binding sensor protein
MRMLKNYTSNDLVRYIYHETSELENTEIRNKINENDSFKNEYLELLKAFARMPKSSCNASADVQNFILNYSKQQMMVK